MNELTDRENEVMQAMAMSAESNSKIAARQLNLSPKTVDAHVQNVMRKMGVRRRMAAILLWDRANRCCPECFSARLTTATKGESE